MDNITFFLKACQVGAYKKKEWAFDVFCVSQCPEEYDEKHHYPGKIYMKDGHPCFVTKDFNDSVSEIDYEYILLNGKMIKHEPIVYPDEGIKIKAGDIPNYTGAPLDTTPGKVFFNWYNLVYAFGSAIPYVNDDRCDPAKLAKKLGIYVSDKEEPGKVTVKQYKMFLSNINAFSGFSGINTPSATEYTMTAAPGILELKEKLLKENKDKLSDPVVVSHIEKQLIAHDEAYIKQDPYEGFYISRKSIDTVRKKLHAMQGIQDRMNPDKPSVLISGALNEPLNKHHFAAAADGSRSGSYFRGAMTALGGEAVKFIYRIFSAASIIKMDCGTTLGVDRIIYPEAASFYIGSYILEGGKSILLTSENIEKYKGKRVIMRSPGYCKADPTGRSYCMKCFGEMMKGRESSLASLGADVTSNMNGRFMKAMHVDTKVAVEINLPRALGIE